MNENQDQNGSVTVKINPKNIFQVWLAYMGAKCGCVLILIIAVLIFSGYFLAKSWQPSIINPFKNSSSSPLSNSSSSGSDDWLRSGNPLNEPIAYNNFEYGFGFKYNPIFKMDETHKGSIELYGDSEPGSPIYEIKMQPNDGKLSLNEIAQKEADSIVQTEKDRNLQPVITDMFIAGQPAKMIVFKEMYSVHNAAGVVLNGDLSFNIEFNNSSPQQEKDFTDFASTFQFIN